MLSPPSLRNAPYYPVTSSIALASIGLTLIMWSGKPMDEFMMTSGIWEKWQLWRALSATLLHGNFFHIAFNLYWFWTFGTLVERVFGHWRCAAIYVLLALCSMLGDYAVMYGGIGLSGVGYGLWGMLWVLEKKDERFLDAVDERTSQTFVVWFFLCIVLTVTKIMPVANVAHGVGALAGALIGLAICARRQVRRESVVGLVAVLMFGILGSTVYWPHLNFTAYAQLQVEAAGLTALENHDIPQGVKLLERAAHLHHAPAHAWYNLGVAYERNGQLDAALAAFKHATQLPDADQQMRDAAKSMEIDTLPGPTNR